MATVKKEFENIPIKTHIDLESSCRICLVAESELILIFDPKNNINDISIATMINECSPFKAIRFDDYPQLICLKCVEDVKIAFAFRKHCEESHSIVTAYLNGGVEPSITDLKIIPDLDKCTQTDENSVFPCEKCDLKFFTFESLRLHRLYLHRGSKNECRICKKSFRRVGYLKGHYTMYHPELGFNENNNCDICGKIFERRTILRRHLENVHKISQIPEPINPSANTIPFATIPLSNLTSDKNTKKILKKQAKKNKKIEIKTRLLKVRISKRKQKPAPAEASVPSKKKLISAAPAETSVPSKKNLISSAPAETSITSKKQLISSAFAETSTISKKNLISSAPAETSITRKKNFISPAPAETSITSKSKKKLISGKKKQSDGELTEDDLPISRLKEKKIIPQNKKKETFSDSDSDFMNDFGNTHWDSDFEDNKSEIKEEIMDIDDNDKNKIKVGEVNLPQNIELKTENDENLESQSENALNGNELKGINSSLKVLTCTVCLKVFRFAHHLKRHMLALHSGEKQFKCSTCSSAFATPDYLKAHMKKCPIDRSIARSRVKKYDCKGCEERFSSTRALNNHMKAEHPNLFKKVFTCSYCAKHFDTRHECTVHTNTVHENDKEYLCTQCGQRFVRNRALEIHMRRHRGEKNHKCKFCGKGFVRAGDKDLHEKYHTGDKRFKCEICNQGFVRNYSLRVHMRIHTGEKPYRCENCPRTFAQSNDLKTHVRRDHTGERFVCEINNCGESFLQLYLLNRHKKNVHNVDAPSHIQRVKKVYEMDGALNNNVKTQN